MSKLIIIGAVALAGLWYAAKKGQFTLMIGRTDMLEEGLRTLKRG